MTHETRLKQLRLEHSQRNDESRAAQWAIETARTLDATTHLEALARIVKHHMAREMSAAALVRIAEKLNDPDNAISILDDAPPAESPTIPPQRTEKRS